MALCVWQGARDEYFEAIVVISFTSLPNAEKNIKNINILKKEICIVKIFVEQCRDLLAHEQSRMTVWSPARSAPTQPIINIKNSIGNWKVLEQSILGIFWSICCWTIMVLISRTLICSLCQLLSWSGWPRFSRFFSLEAIFRWNLNWFDQTRTLSLNEETFLTGPAIREGIQKTA